MELFLVIILSPVIFLCLYLTLDFIFSIMDTIISLKLMLIDYLTDDKYGLWYKWQRFFTL
jgi:hypothetical protein